MPSTLHYQSFRQIHSTPVSTYSVKMHTYVHTQLWVESGGGGAGKERQNRAVSYLTHSTLSAVTIRSTAAKNILHMEINSSRSVSKKTFKCFLMCFMLLLNNNVTNEYIYILLVEYTHSTANVYLDIYTSHFLIAYFQDIN